MVKLERRLTFCNDLVGDDIEGVPCRDFIISGVSGFSVTGSGVSGCSCRSGTEGK